MGVGSWVFLELIFLHNLFTKMAWNRLFFNEKVYYTGLDYWRDTVREIGKKKMNLKVK